MAEPASIIPLGPPHLQRSDSLDLLSPTQSLTGSLSLAYDSSAISSDDEADFRKISRQVANGRNTISPKGSASAEFGGRRLPHVMASSPFNRSSVNRSEYRYLHSRMDDDYDDGDELEGDRADRHSVHSDFHAGSLSHRRRYVYSAVALVVALASFVIQTEAATYIAQDLGYRKPIFTMYVTHSSWIILYPLQLLMLCCLSPRYSLSSIYTKHQRIIYSTLEIIAAQNKSKVSPVRYLMRTVSFIACALTVAGSTWYIAINLTTPSDVTAIYNCSAFFAYAFSVPLLKERFKLSKMFSVILAIAGVLIVAYGDRVVPTDGQSAMEEASNRLLGNIVIGVGAVMYGLYEVLYKRFACPPSTVSVRRSTLFANVFGASIGLFTLTCLWVLIPLLHFLDIETFELPQGEALMYLIVSVLANVAFSGSFLILMSLTSPVLSSVASLLTIFLVALTDWFLFATPLSLGAIVGGLIIAVAFIMLAVASWRQIGGYSDDITDEELAAAEEQRYASRAERWRVPVENAESSAEA